MVQYKQGYEYNLEKGLSTVKVTGLFTRTVTYPQYLLFRRHLFKKKAVYVLFMCYVYTFT